MIEHRTQLNSCVVATPLFLCFFGNRPGTRMLRMNLGTRSRKPGPKPGSRKRPITHGGSDGDFQRFGGFRYREPRKISHLHHLCLSLVPSRILGHLCELAKSGLCSGWTNFCSERSAQTAGGEKDL